MVNLNVGGLGATLDPFSGGTGTSKNFALQITNVKSDLADGTNKALVVTSGGTARWVGITNLTAQSATVLGSATTDTAWAALDGNVLDIGNFTAATDAASTLTATATTGNALLRVGTIDVSGITTNTNAFTLTATGSAANQKTATIELTQATATLGGVTAETTIDLDAGGVLKANNLVLDGLASTAAEDKVAFDGTAGSIQTTGTFTVHKDVTTAATLSNVTAGGKAVFDQDVTGSSVTGVESLITLGSTFTANGLDVTGKGTAKTTLTMASTGTEMLVGAVTAADGDAPASTTLADVTLRGGVITEATNASAGSTLTAGKVFALGTNNGITATKALSVNADVASGTATALGSVTLTGVANEAESLTVKSVTQGIGTTTFTNGVTVTGLVKAGGTTGTGAAAASTVTVGDGQFFQTGFDVAAGGVLDLSSVTSTATTGGITVGTAAVTTGPEDSRTPAVAGNLILADGATLSGNAGAGAASLIKDGTAKADGTGGVSTIVLQGEGNSVEGVIDAGQLSLVAEGTGHARGRKPEGRPAGGNENPLLAASPREGGMENGTGGWN